MSVLDYAIEIRTKKWFNNINGINGNHIEYGFYVVCLLGHFHQQYRPQLVPNGTRRGADLGRIRSEKTTA